MNPERPNPNYLAEKITQETAIKTLADTEEIFYWNKKTGLYEPAEIKLKTQIQNEVIYQTTRNYVNEVLDAIRRMTYTNREEIGENTDDIPLENTIYDFNTGQTRDYTPNDFFLKKHPLKYYSQTPNEKIEPSPIEKFLSEVTGTSEDEVILKEIIGYCFYRKMPFHNFFLLVGGGGNGKSVYLNILRKMIGNENVSNESLQNLVQNRFAPANLYLKNANIFGDLSGKALSDAGTLKLLTGEDTITAEQKFKPSFQFKNYAKIIASCNEVPETPDMSDGFFRRPIIINFPHSFIGKENRNLANELCTPENLSDLFHVCISAFKDALKENNLVRSEGIQQKKWSYLAYSNSAYAFCQETIEYDPECELTTENIYKKYMNFCKKNTLTPKDERVFFQKLYKYFGHKAYKRRKSKIVGLKEVREYVIVGVCWKREE